MFTVVCYAVLVLFDMRKVWATEVAAKTEDSGGEPQCQAREPSGQQVVSTEYDQ